MRLNSEVVKNLYASLYCCYPFTKWKMPLPEEIDFVVTSDPETMGTYMYDEGEKHEHTITISAARCGFMETVIKTVAHEMIHMSRSGTITDAWLKHDATFRRRAHQIGKELGFDGHEL